jgi:hypothetical protein
MMGLARMIPPARASAQQLIAPQRRRLLEAALVSRRRSTAVVPTFATGTSNSVATAERRADR